MTKKKKKHKQKEKGDKSNIFKIENFCVSMDIIKWKDNPQEITVHHTFDKGLGFKIYKNAYNSH